MNYYDPEEPGSFAGARLNKKLQIWLKHQDTYQWRLENIFDG